MAKQKKIGIKYYLNKRLNPSKLGDGDHFPVYVRVIYNRESSQFYFPLLYGDGTLNEEKFESFFTNRSNQKINKQIDRFDSLIIDIIRFESSKIGDKYKIKGLSKKISNYYGSIIPEFENHLKKCLESELSGNEKISFSDISHEVLFFFEVYYLIEGVLNKDLKSELSDSLVNKILAYINLLAFSNTFNFPVLEDNPWQFIDWVRDEKLKANFKDFLFNQHVQSKEFPNKDKDSRIQKLYNEYKCTEIQIPKCLKTIDLVVIELTG